MKLIGCDRCGATFPASKPHSLVCVFDKPTDAEPSVTRELCLSCRSDLSGFFTHPNHEMPAPARRPVAIVAEQPMPDPEPAGDRRGGWSKKVPDRTCEICGRVGKQRFIETATGWRCAPTAVKCPGNHAATEAGESLDEPGEPPVPITAHCQDCTRVFHLTGIPLGAAIEQHELKHGHVVTVAEEVSA